MLTDKVKFIRLSQICLFVLFLAQSYAAFASDDWQWPKAKPSEVGLNIEKLRKSHRAISKKKYYLVDSMLVIRHGKLVYEKYYNAGLKTRAHTLASAGKSLLSAITGIAIDRKIIGGVETRLYSYFKEYYGTFENWDEYKASITLHNLLTMRTGWDCNISKAETRCGSLMNRQRNALEALKWVLDRPMNYLPGEAMQYTDAIVSVLDTLLYITVGKMNEQIFQDFLLKPMGIHSTYKNKLTSRQMAMFGQLYLNKGKWEGKRIISEEWVKKSTSALYPFPNRDGAITRGYGYFWWIANFKSKYTELSVDGYYAAGNGGQYIIVLPSVDMVVVFTGSNFNEFNRMGKQLEIIEKYVVPSIISE